MKRIEDLTGDELLDELGETLEQPKLGGHTAREERLLAGFEDIVRFRETHGRAPQHGDKRDIFERIYAVRLDQLLKMPTNELTLLTPLDSYGLLGVAKTEMPDLLDEEALLAELEEGTPQADDISVLRHVRSPDARRDTPEQVADRTPCRDFDLFRPLFDQAQSDLQAGRREARRFAQEVEGNATIAEGDFFILAGQLVYVAAMGEPIKAPNGESDARLRVIYANGLESNLLRRSLQRALYKDEQGRRITQGNMGPLFGSTLEPEDTGSGTIYVLRSLSKQPEIVAVHDVLHKIGVTNGRVEDRITDAEHDPTYLLAPVEVVATWTLANVKRFKLEQTFHKLFGAAQLQMSIKDRFGRPVQPREWFVVPLPAIDEAVQRIRDGSITGFAYDLKAATLKQL